MVESLANVAERRDHGKSRRHVLHRVDQCHWKPPKTRPDPVDLLVDASRDRLRELLPIKWARMVASPFGFFRGAVPLMAADLASLPTDRHHCSDLRWTPTCAILALSPRPPALWCLILMTSMKPCPVRGSGTSKRLAASLVL